MEYENKREAITWDIPFDRERPIPFVKHCRLPVVTKETYQEVYGLKSELTQEEKQSEFAKYYYLGPACPTEENLKATEYGAQINPDQAFMIEDYVEHMDVPGCCSLKTGYCVLENGVGFASATVTAPGVSARVMSHYIDHFNPPGDLYYKAWYPGSHFRHYENAAVEDVGHGMEYLQFIEGLTAEKIGMIIPAKQDPYCIGITGANILAHPLHAPESEPVYMSELCYYRQMEDCYEERVTFWVGMHFKDGASQLHLPFGKPVEPSFMSALARHSIWETTTFMRNVLEFWKDTCAGKIGPF